MTIHWSSCMPTVALVDDGGQAMAAAAKRIEVGAEETGGAGARSCGPERSQARMVERARIVLEAAEGRSAALIGRRRSAARRSRPRSGAGALSARGLDGLRDLPRPGKPLVYYHAGAGAADRQGLHAPGRDAEGSGASAGPMTSWPPRSGCRPPTRTRSSAAADIKPAPHRVLGDDVSSPPALRRAGSRGLRPLPRPAREHARRLDRREDRHPGQGAWCAPDTHARAGQARPARATSTNATAPRTCSPL